MIAKKSVFIPQALAAVLHASGNFVPLTFLAGVLRGTGYSGPFGSILLSINSAVNSASRIFMGVVADRFGRETTLVLHVLRSAISVWFLLLEAAIGGAKGMWLRFVIIYGILA